MVDLRPGNKQLIRDINLAVVVACIRRHGPIARVDIAERTGLGRSTVTGLVNQLLKDGLLLEVGTDESSGGRKPILLELNPRARFAVGVKLAPRVVTAAVCDLNARVVARVERPVNRSQSPAAVVKTLGDAVRDAMAATGAQRERVLGVGVALPGIVDRRSGTSISPTFFQWANLAIRSDLEAAIGLPVIVENDANVFALAEHRHGAGKGYDHLVCATVGIGIGAGLIADGRLYRGAIAGAGELGHMTINKGGPLCICGNRGCLEALASDGAVVRAARRAMGIDDLTHHQVVAAARNGDRIARRILRQAGGYLGVGLANAINLFNPQRVVLGGEAVQQADELLLAPLQDALRRRAFSVLADQVDVVAGMLGRDAWVVGAATLILEEFFRSPIAEPGADPEAALDRAFEAGQ